MKEQCKAILLPPKSPECFLCWETLQTLWTRHMAKEADRLTADLHLSLLSSRSDTPAHPHFCSKLPANHHHCHHHFSASISNRSHRSSPPTLLPAHPVMSAPTSSRHSLETPHSSQPEKKHTREVDRIVADLYSPFLFQIQLTLHSHGQLCIDYML